MNKDFLYNIKFTALDILFPRRCIFCGKLLQHTQSGCCDNCKKEYLLTQKDNLTIYNDIKIYSSYKYTKNVKQSIYKYKFKGEKSLSLPFADEMINTLKSLGYNNKSFDNIVYVPLPYEREKRRGYNQAKLLAEHISKYFDIPLSSGGLVRESIHLQHELRMSMRLKQEKAGFNIDKNVKIKDNILLIDDIVTTGATIANCVNLLKSNGAKNVVVMTFAKTC